MPQPQLKEREVSEPTSYEASISWYPYYIQGLSEELQRIFKQHGVNVYHKPINTIRSLLVKPKDLTDNADKCGTLPHTMWVPTTYHVGRVMTFI